ncbi:MAG: hypothetical protein Q4B85_08085 [Lachnospiraceae bacterium]|nr:hypothetical protein [Lachnospiraceae bacterium]
MTYRRLPFDQYFIDTSEDFQKTGRVRAKIEYIGVEYTCDPEKHPIEHLLGIRHEVNYAFWYDEERDVIQIHFQKTNSKSDWFANIFEFASKYYDAFPFEGELVTLRVHRGWGDMYKAIKHIIRDQWQALHLAHPQAETEIIGWSLGSGQAMLCCQDLNYNFGIRPYLYTYGSVRPFKARPTERALLERYLNSICRKCCNFANRNDIVTYLPPFPGFRMILRREIGREAISLGKLLNPKLYHTSYHMKELYRRPKHRGENQAQDTGL